MPLSTRAIVVAMFLVGHSLSQPAIAQTMKEANASVSGKVTFKGKPAPGIVVGMRLVREDQSPRSYKATTNADGIYQINNIAGGNYQVEPAAPGMLNSDVENPGGQTVVISQGDKVDGIDFDLIRGGAITGKITDADGHPLIEERIRLIPLAPAKQGGGVSGVSSGDTDDRGVYRVFGLRAGRYTVSVGELWRVDRKRPQLPATYYGDVSDPAKATVIDVPEGGEVSNIDIKVGPQPQTFSATGRVIDDSDHPVPEAMIQLMKTVTPANVSSGIYIRPEVGSDRQGQFRIPNLQPGKYKLYASSGEEGSDFMQQGPLTFEVIDADVSDLVVKKTRGALISGVVVFEGKKPEITREPSVCVAVKEPGNSAGGFSGRFGIEPDGTFVSSVGLPPGNVSFAVGIYEGRYLNLRKIERDGVVQPDGFSIQKREHVSGVRLYVSYSSGSVSGTIRTINGTLPPGVHLNVIAARPDSREAQFGDVSTQADARGQFLLEGLPAGNYELIIVAYLPDSRARQPTAKQTVTVTDGLVTDVLVTLDLTPSPSP